MKEQALLNLAAECGFDHAAPLNPAALEFNPAVRDMCAADRCHSYGRCWTCPPACGTLEEISARAAAYHGGVLLQSTGQLEDDFDVETMMDTEKLQKERFPPLSPPSEERRRTACPCPQGPAPYVRPVLILTRPAASRSWPFPPWKPMDWWSARCARAPACPIITAPKPSPIPPAFWWTEKL